MNLVVRTVVLILLLNTTIGQGQPRAAVFAHNDYEKPNPLHTAYQLQVEYIEVDIFLVGNSLLVGHTQQELKPSRTLDSLYLIPLLHYVNQHGDIYADTTQTLALVIDLKTSANTATVLAEKLKEYPLLLKAKHLKFIISGSVPDRERWPELPDYVYIDGRPGIPYTQEQLKRVALISRALPVRWGTEGLDTTSKNTLIKIRDEVHGKGKPLRFWATPDRADAWKQLIGLGVDVINTDRPADVVSFLTSQK